MRKFSIIIPVYNAEKCLSRCLDSIICQSYTDFEVVLINDGSSDNSGIICDDYKKKDNRFKVFHKENGGVSSARNMGLAYATGEWIVFVDADDEVESNYLEKFLGYEDYDIIQGGSKVCGSVIVDKHVSEEKVFALQNKASELLDFSPYYHPERQRIVYLWGKAFKHDIIQRNHLRFNVEMKMNEDFTFVLDYMSHASKVIEVPNNGYVYYYYGMSKYNMNYEDCVRHIKMFSASIKDCEKTFSCNLSHSLENNIYELFNRFISFLKSGISYEDYKTSIYSLKKNNYLGVESFLKRSRWIDKIRFYLCLYPFNKKFGYFILQHLC